jgi:hypothetical protein
MQILRGTDGIKHVRSPGYNYAFDPVSGEFARWGSTFEEDPKVGQLEIFDLEVSTVCNGIPQPGSEIAVPCKHCYKSNTKVGENMSFETFKAIFDKLPKTLTQIAFGIGDLDANKDLVKMFDYCRFNDHNPGVVPNLTINGHGLTPYWVSTLAKFCGGIAVSVYDNKDVCYNAVEKLINAGIKQVNIHCVIANESLGRCHEVVDDVVTDSRLKGVKAVVFLTLKPKGDRNKWTSVKNLNDYRDLIQYAFDKEVGIGFDSCSAPTFLAAMKDHPQFERLSQLSESCESDRFSGYANVKGEYWHCSFTEEMPGWECIDLLKITNFEKEVWNSPAVKKFRTCLTCQDNKHIAGEVYLCPVYDLYAPEVGVSASAKAAKAGVYKIIKLWK